MLSAHEQATVASAFAADAASTCGVDPASIVDLRGKSGTVTIDETGLVSMFVIDVSELTANQLAERLYATQFRELILKTTVSVVGDAHIEGVDALGVSAVTIKPEAFVPLRPTTTTLPTTTTMTPSTTSTTSAARTSAKEVVLDVESATTTAEAVPRIYTNTPESQDNTPSWWLFALGAGAAGAAVVACVVVVSWRRNHADAGSSMV